MEGTASDEVGLRGSRDLWLEAAYEALVTGGVEAVRILPIGKRINLSRTSFYWFFADRQALLAGLLDRWRDTNTRNLTARAGAYAETLTEAVLNVFDCWIDQSLFDARFEFAVRSWALQSPDVARDAAQADAIRVEALAAMMARHGIRPSTADVRARALYLTQIGYISARTEEGLAERLARIPDYVEIFAGKRAGASEIRRFAARHGASTPPGA